MKLKVDYVISAFGSELSDNEGMNDCVVSLSSSPLLLQFSRQCLLYSLINGVYHSSIMRQCRLVYLMYGVEEILLVLLLLQWKLLMMESKPLGICTVIFR